MKHQHIIAHRRHQRFHMTWTSLPMLIATFYAWRYGFELVAILTALLTMTSTLYHADHEGPRFARWDKACCIASAIVVQLYALLCPLTHEMIQIWLFWGSGIVCWKLGHKCHCTNRNHCGHVYKTFAFYLHLAWHFIATGAIILVLYTSRMTWRKPEVIVVLKENVSIIGQFLLGLQ